MTQPDMNAIIQQAQEMQAKLQAAQEEIVKSSVVGEAGGGLVTITMRGSGHVADMTIDEKVVDPEDVDGLKDLIIGAFADAHTKVQQMAQEKMGPLTQGLGGGDLGGMLG